MVDLKIVFYSIIDIIVRFWYGCVYFLKKLK